MGTNENPKSMGITEGRYPLWLSEATHHRCNGITRLCHAKERKHIKPRLTIPFIWKASSMLASNQQWKVPISHDKMLLQAKQQHNQHLLWASVTPHYHHSFDLRTTTTTTLCVVHHLGWAKKQKLCQHYKGFRQGFVCYLNPDNL